MQIYTQDLYILCLYLFIDTYISYIKYPYPSSCTQYIQYILHTICMHKYILYIIYRLYIYSTLQTVAWLFFLLLFVSLFCLLSALNPRPTPTPELDHKTTIGKKGPHSKPLQQQQHKSAAAQGRGIPVYTPQETYRSWPPSPVSFSPF